MRSMPPTRNATEERTIKVKIGVMGSAGGLLTDEAMRRCRELGRQIAQHNCIIITGACPGLPHEAVLGAKEFGGLAIGISPGLALQEHIDRYHSPYEEYDALIFTGSGLMGREIEGIRSCDIVCIVGGRSGTLGEFAIAFDEGKLICVLRGTGGIAEHIHDIVAMINKQTDAEVMYDTDPKSMIEHAIEKHHERVRRGVAYSLRVVEG
ncbi:MAG: hypothetical protein WCP21_00505 [Armatimonadota bacterium]